MGSDVKQSADDTVVFADEELPSAREVAVPEQKPAPWTILVVDDEEDVHEITRITLKGYTFEGRPVSLLSAYNAGDVKEIMAREDDIALILLDVVMEEEDTGLRLVEYIREELQNAAVRIVLRTGQPGKAPEHAVINQYDINDYKTKPEFTAQKLFTSVTACLRAYKSLKTIERSSEGLESIINASSIVFQNQSFAMFGRRVLEELLKILKLSDGEDTHSAFFMGMPAGSIMLVSGTGEFDGRDREPLEECLSAGIFSRCEKLCRFGGEKFLPGEYIGAFKSKEGFICLLYLKTATPLSVTERNLLRIFANNIAIGFDNISLAREIINTQKEVILTLGEVVETRSQETANHVTRVAEVCYLLARKSGMDEQTAELLRLASPMHDVGKIGVPEAILNKPGRLTPEEFDIIKKHARTGYDILRKSSRSIMQAAAIVALQHHERWDGKGYPQGMAGEDIHIFGRIGALADVFDALSHKRCYKEAWSVEKIKQFFQDSRGTHFDPDLVDIFLAHMDAFVGINKKFPE